LDENDEQKNGKKNKMKKNGCVFYSRTKTKNSMGSGGDHCMAY
jgi:hypothetical protein